MIEVCTLCHLLLPLCTRTLPGMIEQSSHPIRKDRLKTPTIESGSLAWRGLNLYSVLSRNLTRELSTGGWARGEGTLSHIANAAKTIFVAMHLSSRYIVTLPTPAVSRMLCCESVGNLHLSIPPLTRVLAFAFRSKPVGSNRGKWYTGVVTAIDGPARDPRLQRFSFLLTLLRREDMCPRHFELHKRDWPPFCVYMGDTPDRILVETRSRCNILRPDLSEPDNSLWF